MNEAHTHDTFESEPGSRYVVNNKPAIGTGQGLLVLDQLQMEGRRNLPGEEFLRGQTRWLE